MATAIQRGAILTTDIKQVGDTVAGSDCHVQVVGIVSKIPSVSIPIRRIPRTNIRPLMAPYMSDRTVKASPSTRSGFQTTSVSLTQINDILDVLAESNEELAEAIRALGNLPVLAHYNAVMVTPDPLEVADDVVPWVEVTVPIGHTWTPIEAWIVCKTAPQGTPGGAPANSGVIVDVRYAVDYASLDNPNWVSVFKSGLANQLILDESTNQRADGPLTDFA